MTKISNQYSLTNVLFADTTNGRVGVNNGSPTVALDVTGAGRFSGVVTANRGSFAPSFIAIGSSAGNGQIQISNSANYVIGAGTDYGGMSFTVGGSERFNILNNGNVGINTTFAPGPNGLGLAIYKNDFPRITFRNSTTGDQASGGFQFYLNGNDFYQESPAATIFANGGTERMRITSGGTVLIGTTSVTNAQIGAGSLQVNKEIMSVGSLSGLFWENRSSPATATTNWYGWYTSGGTIFLYNGSGNIANINSSSGAYTATSDINKKKDFEQSNIGLNEVLQLKPTLYRMKTDDESSSKDLGFIAQEVKELIPQAYSESGEGDNKFIGLNQMPLIAALTKAIQQQQTQINELKALINA